VADWAIDRAVYAVGDAEYSGTESDDFGVADEDDANLFVVLSVG
jgi:hypothetical protein